MSLLVLIGLSFLVVGLFVAALVAVRFAGRAASLGSVRLASAALAAVAAALIATVLARGGVPSSFPVPLGTPVGSPSLSLDAIGLAFGLPIAVAAVVSLLLAPASALGRALALVASSLLAVLAGDGIVLLVAVGGAALAAWGLSVATVLAPLLLIGALSPLLGGGGIEGGDGFAALRAIGAAEGSGVLGAAASLALGALFVGRPARGLAAADAVLPSLGAFLLVRLHLDLGGGSGPFPTGAAALAAGLVLGFGGARATLLATDLGTVTGGFAAAAKSVVLLLLGVAILARRSDLPASDAAAIGGALLLLLTLAVAIPVACGVIDRLLLEAGTVRLASLGGLAAAAPRLSLILAVAFGTLAFLPPLPGFVPVAMLLDLLLRPERFGGSTLPVLLVLLLGLTALLFGLLLAALVRVGTTVLLGRPRTPRAAATTDPADPVALRTLLRSLVPLAVFAVLPGPILRLLAPAIATLSGAGGAGGAGPFSVGTIDGAAVLPPFLVAAPLGLAALIGWRIAVRRRAADVADERAAWDGGAETAPDWLPFGEPRAQISAPFAARILGEALGAALPPGRLPGEGRSEIVRAALPLRRLAVTARRSGRRLRATGSRLLGTGSLDWRRSALVVLAVAALLGGDLL